MWKIKIICICFFASVNTICYSQNRLKQIKIGQMEGVTNVQEFNTVGGEVKYMKILKDFEASFAKIKKKVILNIIEIIGFSILIFPLLLSLKCLWLRYTLNNQYQKKIKGNTTIGLYH